MRVTHGLLLLGLLGVAAGAATPSAVEPKAADGRVASRQLVSASGGAAARRLFDFTMPDLGGLESQAMQWVNSTLGSMGSAPGITAAVTLFNEAKTYVDQGLVVASAAWTTMQEFAAKMLHIFEGFEPLQPIFAKKDGLVELITSKENMGTLVQTVQELLSTSTVLQSLTDAMTKVSEMFVQLDRFFKELLEKLGGSGRRLSEPERRLADAYGELLSGIDFPALARRMQRFLRQLVEATADLTEVNDVLGPLLTSLQQRFGGTTGNASTARRLMGNYSSIMADAERYGHAINKVVPTWQKVEGLGVEMCPQVGLAKEEASSLQCRVADFAQQAALPSWASSAIGGLMGHVLSDCGGDPEAPKGTSNPCPTESRSAAIPVENVLNETNSNYLGIIIAVLVAGGCLGGGAAAGAKALGRGGGDDSEEGSDPEDAEDATREPLRDAE